MSYLPGWTNVRVGNRDVGFVYQKDGKWVAVLEVDGRTGKDIGITSSKKAAIDLVKAAYLRT